MSSQEDIINETARLADVNDGYSIATTIVTSLIRAGRLQLPDDIPKTLGELAREVTMEISRDRTSKIGSKASAGGVQNPPPVRGT